MECSLDWTSGEKEIIQKLDAQLFVILQRRLQRLVIRQLHVQVNFPEGKPDRKFLESEFPDTPVIIREHSCHDVLLNTQGLEEAGYTEEDFNMKIHGGWFVEKEGDG